VHLLFEDTVHSAAEKITHVHEANAYKLNRRRQFMDEGSSHCQRWTEH